MLLERRDFRQKSACLLAANSADFELSALFLRLKYVITSCFYKSRNLGRDLYKTRATILVYVYRRNEAAEA